MGTDQFSLEINVACIILREKRSQRPVIIENNYSGEYITFECSTGEYIVEIHKNDIVYTRELSISEHIDKTILVISEHDF